MAGQMKRVFAILQEPASYTVDRNHAVYDQLGIEYCYIYRSSEALSDEEHIESLSELNDNELSDRLSDILSNHDIVIMNGYTGKIFRRLYSLNRHFKKVIGIDSDTQLRIPSNFLKRLGKKLYLSHVFSDSRIYGLAGGTGSHKDLFRHYGMNEERVCLMPMVVNNERFATNGQKSGNDKFRFLYVGRLIDVKNLPVMLDAFVKAFECNNEVEIRVVGKGDLLEPLTTQFAEYRNIVFAGPKYGDDLVAEYHHASAFILPSSYEPWGLVVNEAMAAGLPVIVSDQVGAAHDLVKDRDTGFIFPCQDTDKLAECMKRLVEDKELYKVYAANAANLMRDYWNYDLYTKCLLDFINKASSTK